MVRALGKEVIEELIMNLKDAGCDEELITKCIKKYNNDDLKDIFTDSFENEVWQFIKKSDIVTYYYSDYRTVGELLSFLENVKKAYDMALPITLSNRYS